MYGSYCRITGSNESFDTFYPYSETLLADFDEIDKYLINADDIFKNLAGLKSLDGRFNYLSEEQLAHIQRFWSTFMVDEIMISAFISLGGTSLCIMDTHRLSTNSMAYGVWHTARL
jgi:hypothetical protein